MAYSSLVKAAAAALLLLLSLLSAAAPPAEAAVYKVGDKVGWTILGSPNYTAWAISKTFHVGDTLVFEYNKQFHNVLQVTKAAYDSCSAASPTNTYTSGNDTVPIKSAGHLYFLCGIPGHCQAGQKVDILATKGAGSGFFSSAAPSPSAVPPSTTEKPTPVGSPASAGVASSGGSSSVPGPAPKSSDAAGGYKRVGVVAAGVAVVYGFVMAL